MSKTMARTRQRNVEITHMKSTGIAVPTVPNLQQTTNHSRCSIKGFEGLYEVDIEGNVYSLIQTNSRRRGVLKSYDMNGYRKVNLYDRGGKCFKRYVHRLVAKAFIPNYEKKPNVNHIDADRSNNHVNNLEWCTQKENIQHCVKMGRYVSNLHNVRKRVVENG